MPEPAIVYFTSTNPVFGKMTVNQFIETEVKERGNYTTADVQNWMRKYNLSGNDLAIWVSPKKWVANRYNLFAEEWDKAEKIPESKMNVYEIKGNEGFIIPESDDGEEGYLFVFKKSPVREASKIMIREGGTPAPNSNNIVSKIIKEIKEKPWTVPEKRAEIVARLKSASYEIDRKIITGIRSFRPLGVMSELGAAMGAEPRKGVRIDTLMGATVFDEKRIPAKERVDRWGAEHKEAERIRELVPEYAFSLEPRPNTVTGNYRVVEHGERLKAQGLLSPEEEQVLNALEKYWQEHPEFDRQKGYGVWGHNLEIMVPESLRKSEKPEPTAIKATEAKQPWQMTRSEAIAEAARPLGPMGISWGEMRTALSTSRKFAESLHKDMVKLAIVEGKPVPGKVLRDYPDLAESYPVNKTWKMNRKEALNFLTSTNMDLHRRAIKEALEVGLTPYEGWEKDYPDLTAKRKEPWEMTYREFADFFRDVWGEQEFTFGEQVGKHMGILSQGGAPYHIIQGKKIGYSGTSYRDLWRLAIVDKALSEGKTVPEDVLADLAEKLKHEREKLGGTGMAEQYEEKPPTPEVKSWMKRALGIEDYKGGRHDRIQMLALLIQNSELGNIRSISDAGNMALALGKDLEYGTPPPSGKSQERYYAEKIAAETGREVHIIKSSDIIKPPVQELKVPVQSGAIAGGTPARQILTVTEPEGYYFGTQIEVLQGADPDLEPYFTGTIKRLLNNGEVVEVHPEGDPGEVSIRVPVDRVNVTRLVTQEAPKKLYRYYYSHRPPGIGTQPEGFINHESWLPARAAPHGRTAFGWVEYDRPLTLEEISGYELFEDVVELPKLVKELVQFARDEGIDEAMKAIDAEYGRAVWDWLKSQKRLTTRGQKEQIRAEIMRLAGITAAPLAVPTGIEKIKPEQAIRLAADSIDTLRRVDVFRVLNQYKENSIEIGNYIKSNRPDLVAEVDRILGEFQPKDKFAEIQDQMQRDKEKIIAESLYKRYTSGYSTVSLLGIVQQDTKDLAHSIGFELKLDTAIYTPAVLLRIAEKFKEFAQKDYEKEHARTVARQQKEAAEKEKERLEEGQAFWDEVKNLKVVDFEVEHDINPDKPTRTYYHVYDRTFAVLENGKRVQVSYVIYKGEDGKRALKATKEFYMRIYGQYMGKPLSEWITYEDLMRGNRYGDYKAQQPRPRFTFIPEVPPAVPSQGVEARFNAYISSTMLTTGALASPKFLSDERMAQDIERNIQVSLEEARKLVPQFRAIAEKRINKEEIESVKELFGIDLEQEAHNTGIDLADYAIIKAGNRVILQHKTIVQRMYEIKEPKEHREKTDREMAALTAKKEAEKIKQQTVNSIQEARTVEELQPVLKGIGFLPLTERDKQELIRLYQNRFSTLMSEKPFGAAVKVEGEKPRVLGAPSPQEQFEAEQRKKAAAASAFRGQQKLTSGASVTRKLSEFGIKERMLPGMTASMRAYIQGAQAIREVIHYFRDGRTPTRGVLYRARDRTYFVEANDGQVYASMGWEEVKAQAVREHAPYVGGRARGYA